MLIKNRLRVAFVIITVLALTFNLVDPGHAQEKSTTNDGAGESDRSAELGVRINEPEAFTGYTLIAPYLSTITYLVDMQGEVVHQWESEDTPAAGAYLLDDGSLLRCADTENPRFRSNGTGGRVQLFDWDGTLKWDYLVSDDKQMQNHDFEPLPNGNVLVAAWEYRSRDEALAAGLNPKYVTDQGLWPCLLLEIEPMPPDGGRVVWEWNAWDHLIQDFDPTKENHGEVSAHPELLNINIRPILEMINDDENSESAAERTEELRELEEEMESLGYLGGGEDEESDSLTLGMGVDFMHVNGVSYDPKLDLIVLSSWELSEVLVIDHSTTTQEAAGHTGGRYNKGGDILYRWGNPQNYGAGNEDHQQFFRQHDARWLPGPRILVFNNDAGSAERDHEGGRGRSYSTIDEIKVPFTPDVGFSHVPGAAFGPTKPVWSYRAENPEDFYGSFISGAHRLANGNTLICEGPKGRLFEVTPDHRTVWEYVIPFDAMSVSDWWGRFGWDDMAMEDLDDEDMDDEDMDDEDMDDEDMDDEDMDDEDMEGWEESEEEFMVSQAAFRATRIAPDHPGLRRLKR
jgi:hypothetical protein